MEFDEWLWKLGTDVLQEEFGYEPGEFTVYPEHWRPLYDEGLSPRAAWQRALDAFAQHRREEDCARAENWKRIQAADAAIREQG